VAIKSQYITEDQFVAIMGELNIAGKEDAELQELLDRSVGDLEADLCERFIVPLVEVSGGAYSTAPAFARRKVLNAIKSKIRELVGRDHNRNLVIDSTQKYIDVHKSAYQADIKVLLDPLKVFGFQLQPQAEGAVEPMQHVGLARANNDPVFVDDPDI
jgi:hypothetical protein